MKALTRDSRKRFEAWVMACHSAHFMADRNRNGKYVDERMQLMWSAYLTGAIHAALSKVGPKP